MLMSVLCSVMFSCLYLPILLMVFKCYSILLTLCILICECTWLFLSLSVVCLFFDTLYFSFFVSFNFSNVLQVFRMYLNLRVYLFAFIFVIEVLFSFFFCVCVCVIVNFSDMHYFSVKIKVSDWVERNFFSLTIFGGNFLAWDVHLSMTISSYVQAWQWIGSISLLTWGLLWASASSLEACGSILDFLLLVYESVCLLVCNFACRFKKLPWRHFYCRYIIWWDCLIECRKEIPVLLYSNCFTYHPLLSCAY